MDGLKEILSKIDSNNAAEIKEYVSAQNAETQKMTDEIINSARSEAEKILADAAKKTAQLSENSKSSCALYEKNRLLTEKLNIINNAVDTAAHSLKNMDSDEYFKAVETLVIKYSHDGEGELLMNERDRAAVPDGFMESLNKKLKEKNASVSLADESAKIDSGVIIRYGGIEENCTFGALIGEKRDEIRDILFKEFD